MTRPDLTHVVGWVKSRPALVQKQECAGRQAQPTEIPLHFAVASRVKKTI